MTAALATTGLTADEARELESAFLSGMNEAQDAFERIIATQAWVQLGHETLADWWTSKVQPIMRALSLRPQPALAAAVVDQVRAEEAGLPSAQRRTQKELAEMAGVDQKTVSNWSRSTPQESSSKVDLEHGDTKTPEPAAALSAAQVGSGSTSAPAASPSKPGADPDPAADSTAPRQDPAWSDEQADLRKRLESGETVVVSLRAHHADLVAWAAERDLLVRVDRRTDWGNPFELPGDGTRDQVIANYAGYYLPHKPSLLMKVAGLKGKALGCWCAPEPCHGHVLRWLAEANGDQAPALDEELPAMAERARLLQPSEFTALAVRSFPWAEDEQR